MKKQYEQSLQRIRAFLKDEYMELASHCKEDIMSPEESIYMQELVQISNLVDEKYNATGKPDGILSRTEVDALFTDDGAPFRNYTEQVQKTTKLSALEPWERKHYKDAKKNNTLDVLDEFSHVYGQIDESKGK